jgi:hypothetical protein
MTERHYGETVLIFPVQEGSVRARRHHHCSISREEYSLQAPYLNTASNDIPILEMDCAGSAIETPAVDEQAIRTPANGVWEFAWPSPECVHIAK